MAVQTRSPKLIPTARLLVTLKAVAGGNSGIINYINKFGYANGYKSYDPISEMYYEIVRYFKNLGPSTDNYCSGLTTATDDGFKLFCGTYNGQNWRDPYLYSCQNGVVLAINDANPWCDKRVPGTAWTAPTGGPSCTNDGGEPSNANTFTDATTGTGINVTTWTNKVGNYEFGSSITLNVGCVQGGACDWSNTSKTFTDLGRASGTAPYTAKQNSYYIAGLSYYAHTNDLRSDLAGTQTLTTYMIDTQESNTTMLVGRKSMLFLAAKYGGFTNLNGLNVQGDMVPDQTIEWDKDADGFPDNYLLASSDPSMMEQGFARFFLDIMNRASSGTAASVLASSEGSGANILQALFYPKRPFGTQEISWTGEMQNLWYYVDPYLQNANIREDTDTNKTLNLVNDNVIQFYFDSIDNQVKVRKYEDTDGNGSPDTFLGTSRLEDIKNLWEVGSLMWSRDLGSLAKNHIYRKPKYGYFVFVRKFFHIKCINAQHVSTGCRCNRGGKNHRLCTRRRSDRISEQKRDYCFNHQCLEIRRYYQFNATNPVRNSFEQLPPATSKWLPGLNIL